MSIRRITAIVSLESLDSLELHLRACGVPGVTVEHVQGYGQHPNFFRKNLMNDNARVVLYVGKDKVNDVVSAVVQSTADCGATSGILAVERIDRLVSLTSGDDIGATQL